MKRIFMTGITGLLGTNLANELLKDEYEITAVVRDTKRYIGKNNSKLKLVQCGLFDDYDDHLESADIVIHIAAVTAIRLIDHKNFDKINYEGTVRLFRKSEKYKVKTFIFISTSNTIGYGDMNNPGTENAPVKKPFTNHLYAQSKLKAERFLIENNQVLNLLIINPAMIIGPYDSKPGSGRIILNALHKSIVFYPPGGKSFVSVKDVVNAIIQSINLGKNNSRYLISGENLTYLEFYKRLKNITGDSQIFIKIPAFLLVLLGYLGSALRLLRLKTRLSLPNMQSLCIRNYYSNKKSIQDLQLSYHSLDDAIKDAVDYFNKEF